MNTGVAHTSQLYAALAVAAAGLVGGTVSSRAQGFAPLHTFNGSTATPDGIYPKGALVLSGNKLYGTTAAGGTATNVYSGTVFSVNTDGTGYTILHSFNSSVDGSLPEGRLVLSAGTLYGAASSGGAIGNGTIFSLSTNGGGFAVLYNFSARGTGFVNSDGANPHRLFLFGSVLYGTTGEGGAYNQGTLFSISTNGQNFIVLHHFNALTANPAGGPNTNWDGTGPGALVAWGDVLFGNAYGGGANGWGTIYSVNTDGNGFTVLHAFSGRTGSTNADGEQPIGDLALAGNALYGTAVSAGPNRYGTAFSLNTNGTGFAVLHAFNSLDGSIPYSGLILAGNTLYGMANHGGSGNHGDVFALNTDGSGFNVLYNFSAFPGNNNTNNDGAWPVSGLAVADNRLYGTAEQGGPNAAGTAFALTILPEITGITVTGMDLVINGINGLAGHNYITFRSTDAALPLNKWTAVATNVLASSGNFSFIATNAVPTGYSHAFYALRQE
jgi:uncharacterized repeat protein (TIGR03803 family)